MRIARIRWLRHPISVSVALFLLPTIVQGATTQEGYVPPRGLDWKVRSPAALGFDPQRLSEAVTFARAHEIPWPRDLQSQLTRLGAGRPYPELLGPTTPRGGTNGIILRHGYIVAEWGDTKRVDMTFSVTKSYLALVAGVAHDRGLLPYVDAPVHTSLPEDPDFVGPHNRPITWRHLLTQTSEWTGTLWDKPDLADRREGLDRTLNPPGSFWEYNDVRVNRTSHALLQILRTPLPEVLKEAIMDPIGASDEWVWHGYDNSWVTLDGRRMQSVSGGGHWGGGFWGSTRDHARIGLLMSRKGRWGDTQLLSAEWIRQATTPTPIKPVYGWFWWLNTDAQQYSGASTESFFALGGGGNMIWIDPTLDIVAVVRWMNPASINDFLSHVTRAVNHDR